MTTSHPACHPAPVLARIPDLAAPESSFEEADEPGRPDARAISSRWSLRILAGAVVILLLAAVKPVVWPLIFGPAEATTASQEQPARWPEPGSSAAPESNAGLGTSPPASRAGEEPAGWYETAESSQPRARVQEAPRWTAAGSPTASQARADRQSAWQSGRAMPAEWAERSAGVAPAGNASGAGGSPLAGPIAGRSSEFAGAQVPTREAVAAQYRPEGSPPEQPAAAPNRPLSIRPSERPGEPWTAQARLPGRQEPSGYHTAWQPATPRQPQGARNAETEPGASDAVLSDYPRFTNPGTPLNRSASRQIPEWEQADDRSTGRPADGYRRYGPAPGVTGTPLGSPSDYRSAAASGRDQAPSQPVAAPWSGQVSASEAALARRPSVGFDPGGPSDYTPSTGYPEFTPSAGSYEASRLGRSTQAPGAEDPRAAGYPPDWSGERPAATPRESRSGVGRPGAGRQPGAAWLEGYIDSPQPRNWYDYTRPSVY